LFLHQPESGRTPDNASSLLQVDPLQLIDHLMELFMFADADFLFLDPIKAFGQFGQCGLGKLPFPPWGTGYYFLFRCAGPGGRCSRVHWSSTSLTVHRAEMAWGSVNISIHAVHGFMLEPNIGLSPGRVFALAQPAEFLLKMPCGGKIE